MKSKIPSVLLMKSPSVKDIPRVRYIEPLTSSSASPVINVPINCLIKKKKATTIIGPVITSAKYQHLSILYLPFVYFPASAWVLTQVRMPVITPNSPEYNFQPSPVTGNPEKSAVYGKLHRLILDLFDSFFYQSYSLVRLREGGIGRYFA